MAPNLSKARKDRIAQHIYAGLTKGAICELEHVSRSTVQNIKKKLNTYGGHTAPKELAKMGRPRAITGAMVIGLSVYLLHRPWASQDEMITYLFDEWGTFCSQPTISKALKIHRISTKIIQEEALKRSQICRDEYMKNISELSDPQSQLCFLDESAANEHTCHRKHGWSRFDITPRASLSIKRSERWSILPCYDTSGIFAYHIQQGVIDGACFEWFLENHVLPQCNPYPGPRSVLVMDNALIHHHPVSFSPRHRFCSTNDLRRRFDGCAKHTAFELSICLLTLLTTTPSRSSFRCLKFG